MMKAFTTEQIEAQKQRFDAFMASVNLHKVGERWMWFTEHDNHDGRFNAYCYIHRVLRFLARVEGSMYHPDRIGNKWPNEFYADILTNRAVYAYVEVCWEKVTAGT